MHLLLGRTAGGDRLIRRDTDGSMTALTGASSVAELLRHSLTEIRAIVEAAGEVVDAAEVRPRSIVDGRMEVWAAGVTYKRSRTARAEESTIADVYDRVYDAERPELFFKSVPWRVVIDGEPIGVRADSPINVPEPELAVVVDSNAEIVGYTICNDVSSRSIEGENPLYLPQAKVYDSACAVAATIRPAWEVDDPYDLAIEVMVERSGSIAWEGTSSTSLLHRRLPHLVAYAFKSMAFPDGMVLSTGTPLVPEMTFDLAAGDVVTIRIQDVGELRNPVVEVGRA
jgi:2-dehydro-3-deoxy-D-arabinonate dehydratase